MLCLTLYIVLGLNVLIRLLKCIITDTVTHPTICKLTYGITVNLNISVCLNARGRNEVETKFQVPRIDSKK